MEIVGLSARHDRTEPHLDGEVARLGREPLPDVPKRSFCLDPFDQLPRTGRDERIRLCCLELVPVPGDNSEWYEVV